MDEIYQHWTRRLLFTSGAKYVADTAQAYWLIDLIASHQQNPLVRQEEFQVWKLVLLGNGEAVAQMTDGNSDKPILEQRIEYTDYPDPDGVEMYLVKTQGQPDVLMLPCEY